MADYAAQHSPLYQEAIARLLSQVIDEQAADPLGRLGALLVQEAAAARTEEAAHVSPPHSSAAHVSPRKTILADLAGQLAAEARAEVATAQTPALGDEAASVLDAKLKPMLDETAEAFHIDARFEDAVSQALAAKRAVGLAASVAASTEGGLRAAMAPAVRLQRPSVDLSSMELAEGGADAALVVAWMRSQPAALRALKIAVEEAGAPVVAALHDLAAETKSLVELDIGEAFPPKPLDARKLNGADKECRSLDLREKKLGPASARLIAATLGANATLECIMLSNNALGPEGGEALGGGLANTRALREVTLKDNKLGDRGIVALAEALKTNATLESIDLSGNGVGPVGGTALAEALELNSTLTSLNCRGNDIGQGAAAIAEALKVNTVLKKLNIGRNGLGDAADLLKEAVKDKAGFRLEV